MSWCVFYVVVVAVVVVAAAAVAVLLVLPCILRNLEKSSTYKTLLGNVYCLDDNEVFDVSDVGDGCCYCCYHCDRLYCVFVRLLLGWLLLLFFHPSVSSEFQCLIKVTVLTTRYLLFTVHPQLHLKRFFWK